MPQFSLRLLIPGRGETTHTVTLELDQCVQEIRNVLRIREPELRVKNILFAGQILKGSFLQKIFLSVCLCGNDA